MTTDFERFWRLFPRRVGRLAAQKAYVKARKIASAEQIVQGVDRYIANKPTYADWAHPTTWLNNGRWMDEYEDQRSGADRRTVARGPERRTEWSCTHTPSCESRWQCHQRAEMDAFRAAERARTA